MSCRRFSIVSFVSFLLFFSVASSVVAMAGKVKTEQGSFTLKVTGNLINLQAKEASFKDILIDLEKKTGIKVKVFDGVDDKKVSLNIRALPVYAIHTLLEKIGLDNFAVVYDEQLASKVIYILPAGKNINEIFKDKTKTILFSSHIINVDVAQLVAEAYLPKYYPGDWVFFDSFILYDLDGIPAAYAIVFRQTDSEITTLQKLEDSMSEARLELDKISEQISNEAERKNVLLLKAQLRKQKELLYKWNSFATVITGATEASSLVINHYRGLPPIFVSKVDLQRSLESDHPGENLALGRMLFLSSFDLRYEVRDVGGSEQNIYAINIKTKKLEKISFLKEKIRKFVLRKARKRDLMTPEERELYDKGVEFRDKRNLQKWQQYMSKS